MTDSYIHNSQEANSFDLDRSSQPTLSPLEGFSFSNRLSQHAADVDFEGLGVTPGIRLGRAVLIPSREVSTRSAPKNGVFNTLQELTALERALQKTISALDPNNALTPVYCSILNSLCVGDMKDHARDISREISLDLKREISTFGDFEIMAAQALRKLQACILPASVQLPDKAAEHTSQMLSSTRSILSRALQQASIEPGQIQEILFTFANNICHSHSPHFLRSEGAGIHGLVLNYQMPADQAAELVIDAAIRKFAANKNMSYLVDDLTELKARLIAHIHEAPQHVPFDNLPPHSILVGEHIDPVTLNEVGPTRNIAGFIDQRGSYRGHSVSLALSNNWAAVVGISGLAMGQAEHSRHIEIKNGDVLLVDGLAGVVYVNPDKDRIKWYMSERRKRHTLNKQIALSTCALTDESGEPTGRLMAIVNKMDKLQDIAKTFPAGHQFVGLVRTEYEIERRKILNDEQGQYQLYREIQSALDGRITFRTFDWDADKVKDMIVGQNPSMAEVGLRYSLKPSHQEQFKLQLRAMLRCSEDRKIRILFPLVSDAEEVMLARNLVSQAGMELEQRRKAGQSDGNWNPANVEIGIMVETTAAYKLLDTLLPLVDFVSLGTNDFTQYGLAFDRTYTGDTESHMEKRFREHHPAILRMLKEVVEEADQAGKPISCCGMMVSDPNFLPVIKGLGIKYLSVMEIGAAAIHKTYEALDWSACRQLVSKMMAARGPAESLRLLEQFNQEFWKQFQL